MPTVLRLDGLKVVIYPTDHRPAHVHVTGTDGPPELREAYGRFNSRKLSRIQNDLAAHLFDLCRKWSEIHDRY